MSAKRRALAVLALPVLGAAAPPAGAATVQSLPCVSYVLGPKKLPQPTLPITASGFAPGSVVTISTVSRQRPAPAVLVAGRAGADGVFKTSWIPPKFAKDNTNLQTFTLIASGTSGPATPVVATTPLKVVRFGLTRTPPPSRAKSRITFTARGFTAGRPVYMHFRFRGTTRRTVSLGKAEGVCGIVSRRLLALPTRVRFGTWTVFIDQSKRYSGKTRPQWIDSFRIFLP